MSKLCEQSWFIKTVTWLNDHWSWWKTNIYGNSKDMCDFVRNPAEVLRDTYFPFVIKNINPISIINARFGYIVYDETKKNTDYLQEVIKYTSDPATIAIAKEAYAIVPMGDKRVFKKVDSAGWCSRDIRLFNKWWTKFANSKWFFQIAVSMKWNWLPIPYVAFVYKYEENKYFQTGLGYGPQLQSGSSDNYDTVLCLKMRFADYQTELEADNVSDVIGLYEGTN